MQRPVNGKGTFRSLSFHSLRAFDSKTQAFISLHALFVAARPRPATVLPICAPLRARALEVSRPGSVCGGSQRRAAGFWLAAPLEAPVGAPGLRLGSGASPRSADRKTGFVQTGWERGPKGKASRLEGQQSNKDTAKSRRWVSATPFAGARRRSTGLPSWDPLGQSGCRAARLPGCRAAGPPGRWPGLPGRWQRAGRLSGARLSWLAGVWCTLLCFLASLLRRFLASLLPCFLASLHVFALGCARAGARARARVGLSRYDAVCCPPHRRGLPREATRAKAHSRRICAAAPKAAASAAWVSAVWLPAAPGCTSACGLPFYSSF